jgi:hypothetical protein
MAIAPALLAIVERFNLDDVLYGAVGNLIGSSRPFIARDANRDSILGDDRHFRVPNVSNPAAG